LPPTPVSRAVSSRAPGPSMTGSGVDRSWFATT
jgi:hypothetical protein